MKTKNIISISDNGLVHIPTTIQMRDFEIAELFDIMIPTVRGKIKTLLKSRFIPNCSGGILMGNSIIPEYFGLELVIAIAFQIQSVKTEIFRKWVTKKFIDTSRNRLQYTFIQLTNGQILN